MNDLPPEQLICGAYEDWTIQCVATEEDGSRCIHGSRNKKMRLCSRHYARYQRNGHTGVSTDGTAKRRKREKLAAKQERMEQEGKSKVCICAHAYAKHSMNENCLVLGCRCFTFNGVNELVFHDTMRKFRNLAFMEPLNDTAMCRQCLERIQIGKWHDPMAIRRIREHLRVKHVVPRIARAG